MRWAWTLVSVAVLAGCAGGQQVVQAPPVAEDLSQAGWSAPSVPSPAVVGMVEPVEPPKARSTREKVYEFKDGDVYQATVGLGAPLNLRLQPGERIHNLVGGDRTPMAEGQDTSPPWEVKEGLSGAGDDARPHVFITAVRAGLRTGLTITTTKRTYELELRSVGRSPVRSVRWTYPDDLVRLVAKAPEPSPLPDPTQPRSYHVPYTIQTSNPRPPWSPRQVVDDGWKTYVLFPPTVTTIDAPLVRLIGPNGPEVLNARQVGSVMVLDRIIHRIELRIGAGDHAEIVTVQRETPRTINCPGHEECPVWPETVARRAE
jgi:P-type conjugative transfer protein TrbG